MSQPEEGNARKRKLDDAEFTSTPSDGNTGMEKPPAAKKNRYPAELHRTSCLTEFPDDVDDVEDVEDADKGNENTGAIEADLKPADGETVESTQAPPVTSDNQPQGVQFELPAIGGITDDGAGDQGDDAGYQSDDSEDQGDDAEDHGDDSGYQSDDSGDQGDDAEDHGDDAESQGDGTESSNDPDFEDVENAVGLPKATTDQSDPVMLASVSIAQALKEVLLQRFNTDPAKTDRFEETLAEIFYSVLSTALLHDNASKTFTEDCITDSIMSVLTKSPQYQSIAQALLDHLEQLDKRDDEAAKNKGNTSVSEEGSD